MLFRSSVIVADIDHDGHLDLSALSEHRGVKVWLNKGGHGRFAALRKKHGPVGARLSRTPLATPKGQGDGESDAEPGPGCLDCLAHQTSVGRFVPPPSHSSVLPDSRSAKPGDIGSGPISRGPPLVATA